MEVWTLAASTRPTFRFPPFLPQFPHLQHGRRDVLSLPVWRLGTRMTSDSLSFSWGRLPSAVTPAISPCTCLAGLALAVRASLPYRTGR